MSERRRKTLLSFQASYLKFEIEGGSLIRRKQALQQICRLSWSGVVLLEDDRKGMENAILGVLSSALSDEKIRRWALVALAYVGRKNVSRNAVMRALSDYPDEPQVLAAAIATLFKFDGGETQTLLTHQGMCTPEMIVLSGLQTVNPRELDVSKTKINIQTASPILLKLALLLVGLDKAPPHLFDPKYPNSEIVKVLGAHHEPIVSQYSVWAVAENPNLGISDIGINFKTIDDYPPNVRAYIYRMFAEDKARSVQRHDIIAQGQQDPELESRLGLAIGLRDSFFDGLADITIDWFYDEQDEDVKLHVLDHIVAQAYQLESYKRIALEQFDLVLNDEKKRMRLEAAAAGTILYPEFKRLIIQKDAGLLNFLGGNMVTNNFFNHGTMQGAFSQSGTANNDGQMQALLNASQVADAHNALDKISAEIDSIPLSEPLKIELRKALGTAKTDTTKNTLKEVVTTLETAQRGFKAVSGMATHAMKIGGYILLLTSLIG